MSKQFATFYVSWRDTNSAPLGIFSSEANYGRAAAAALEKKLNELAEDGWIIDQIIPSTGISAQQNSSFTVVAFR